MRSAVSELDQVGGVGRVVIDRLTLLLAALPGADLLLESTARPDDGDDRARALVGLEPLAHALLEQAGPGAGQLVVTHLDRALLLGRLQDLLPAGVRGRFEDLLPGGRFQGAGLLGQFSQSFQLGPGGEAHPPLALVPGCLQNTWCSICRPSGLVTATMLRIWPSILSWSFSFRPSKYRISTRTEMSDRAWAACQNSRPLSSTLLHQRVAIG